MACASGSDKPRLLTSLVTVSGEIEAYIGMRIVLVGQLREHVLLWCVFSISLAVDKDHLASLLDCDDLCYNRFLTLSVRHSCHITSDALRVHTYHSNYTKRAEQRRCCDRCKYVPYIP